MEKTLITSSKYTPAGAYSYGFKVKGGTWLIMSGKGSLSPSGEVIGKGNMEAQVRATMDGIVTIIGEAGATLKDVIKATTYVTSIEEYRKVRHVVTEYYKKAGREDYPAGTLVEISRLAKEGMMLEIEVIAVVE